MTCWFRTWTFLFGDSEQRPSGIWCARLVSAGQRLQVESSLLGFGLRRAWSLGLRDVELSCLRVGERCSFCTPPAPTHLFLPNSGLPARQKDLASRSPSLAPRTITKRKEEGCNGEFKAWDPRRRSPYCPDP